MSQEIDVKNMSHVEQICRLACKVPYEVFLSTGTVLVDARSMLSMLTMVGKKALVVADNETDAAGFASLVQELA